MKKSNISGTGDKRKKNKTKIENKGKFSKLKI